MNIKNICINTYLYVYKLTFTGNHIPHVKLDNLEKLSTIACILYRCQVHKSNFKFLIGSVASVLLSISDN